MGRILLAATTAALLMSGAAHAATLAYTTDFSAGVGAEWTVVSPENSGDAGVLGRLSNNGSDSTATLSLTSPGASTAANNGTLVFDLLGFTSIDGAFNCCSDLFTLKINGSTVYQAYFGMQYANDLVVTDTNGATYTSASGLRTITVPFTAVVGANSFAFSYGPLQGIGDESWALDNVGVRAAVNDATPGIPEPSTWALMIAGFGGAGAMLRRRRAVALA